MLTTTKATTILPVTDPERASRFYRDQLGLRSQGVGSGGTLMFDLGQGDALGLMPAEEGAQTGHTVLSFEVPNIEAEIAELEGKGVRFEDYDLPDLKTVDHICVLDSEKAAWFHDSEGNVLCLHQVTG
jgi:predicted enzyme related to lactoylglutathione lyase